MSLIMNETLSQDLITKTEEIRRVAAAIDDLNWTKVSIVIPQFLGGNVVSVLSERSAHMINTILSHVIQNIDYTNNNDKLINNGILSIYCIRDIIENLEVMCYLLMKTDEISEDLTDEIYIKLSKQLNGESNMDTYSINPKNKNGLEHELCKKYGEDILTDDFKKLRKIKRECNNYIHKNGLKYFKPFGRYDDFMNKRLSDLIYVYKIYFKILFLLKGHFIASSDYIDYLDMGMKPPERSQYWIAPIFINYINNQFNEEEKQWLIKHNKFEMEIETIMNS